MADITWQEDIKIKQKYPTLNKDLNVDVLIIGAGITGISTAYLLSKHNLNVALIEKGVIAKDSATAYTTAFITQSTDTSLSKLSDTFGAKNAKLCWEAGEEAISLIEKNVKKENIDCDFVRCSDFEYVTSEDGIEGYKKEANLAKKMGFKAVFHKNNLNFTNFGYIELKRQAKFHPLKYLTKLSNVAVKNGVKIYEKTEAVKVTENNSLEVKTKDVSIFAKHVVMATYSPFNHPLSMYFKAGLYTTYVFEVEIAKGIFREGIYEDDNSPYIYFRIDSIGSKSDRMIIGGEDHRADIAVSAKKSFKALEAKLKQILGDRPYKIKNRWSGPILEPIDGMPYIGKLKPESHQYITHGFSGNGMTYATIAAVIFDDLIMGKANKYAKLFDPKRLPTLKQLITKGKDYQEELVGAAIKNTLSY